MANISKNINNSKNKTKLENIRISTTTALREKIVNIDENDLYDDEDEDLDYQELPEYEDRDEDDDPFDFDDDDPLNKDYSTKEEENENDFVLSRRNKVIFRIFWDCEINNYKILSLFDETVESYKINLDRKEVLTNWLDEFDKKELELIIKGGINYTSRFLKILSKKIKATDEKNKQYFETYAGAFSSFFIQFEDGLVLTADLVLVSEKGRDIDEYRDFNSDYHKAILLYLSYLLYYCNKKESNLLNKRFDRKEFGRFIDASKKIIKEEFPKGIDEKIFNIYNNYKDCIKESCNTNTEYLLDVWLKERPNEKNKNYLKDILRDLKKSFNESENKESFEKKLTEIYDKLFLLEKDKKNYNNKQINPFNFIKNRNAIVLEKLKKSIENNKTKDKDEILNNSLIYGIDKRKITINKFDFGFIKTDYLPSYLINLTIEKEEENFETSIYYPIFQTDGDLSAVYLINGALYYLPFFRIINQNEEIKYYNGYDFFRLWYDKIYNNFEKLKNSYDKDSYEFKIYLIKKFLFGWDKVKWQKPLRYIGNFTSICAIDSLRSVINTYIEKDITISGGKISFYKFVSDTSNPNTRIYPYKGKVDFGIDPINTPENESIRVTGRLSYNCFLEEEKIRLKDEDFLPMSRDTLQIPYKGWTEPRRLLLGANLLAKAISLNNNETPLCNPISHFKNISIPDGHNLLTLFMTYSGLNHEDAWVISESASRKYYTEETKLHIIPISNFLIEYHILVKVGEKVKRGDKLCEGFYRDIFLSRRSKNEKKYVRMNYPGNFSSIEGEVTDIQIINTMNFERDGILSGFYIPMYYKEIVVVSIKKKKPLRIGDKLANRHGHKGIIGKIIPDEEMPTVIIDGEEKSAEALIDPISVLNRDNWGQL
ncbi:MAG TPA: hypothetical protein PK899_00855, partial [Spirochaetota bacterium]|nr:hypothetical protein [Spirochaetota bacterium]